MSTLTIQSIQFDVHSLRDPFVLESIYQNFNHQKESNTKIASSYEDDYEWIEDNSCKEYNKEPNLFTMVQCSEFEELFNDAHFKSVAPLIIERIRFLYDFCQDFTEEFIYQKWISNEIELYTAQASDPNDPRIDYHDLGLLTEENGILKCKIFSHYTFKDNKFDLHWTEVTIPS